MSNIIFITSKYWPSPDANGICVQQIVKQLKSEGHQIICICVKEDGQLKHDFFEGIEIFRVKKTLYATMIEKEKETGKKSIAMILLTLLRRILSLAFLPIFPNTEPYRTRKIYRAVELIVQQKSIDCVIGVFRPFEGVAVAQKIRRKYPKIICGGYYLDIMKGANIPKIFPKKMYSKLCDVRELKIFNSLDFILMAEAGKIIYEKPYFKSVKEKINYINFPVFRNIGNEIHQRIEYDKKYYNIVYAGYLDRTYRNPTFIFKVIQNLNKKGCKIKLHLYGRNNCIDIINEYIQNNPDNFCYYGTVDSDKAKEAILSADAVLNISNKTNSIVPSKVFELFSSCKPIINVVTNPCDVSLDYFNYYPTVSIIEEYKGDIEMEMKKLWDFLYLSKNCTISYDEIESLYYSSTPTATINIINKCIHDKRKS